MCVQSNGFACNVAVEEEGDQRTPKKISREGDAGSRLQLEEDGSGSTVQS